MPGLRGEVCRERERDSLHNACSRFTTTSNGEGDERQRVMGTPQPGPVWAFTAISITWATCTIWPTPSSSQTNISQKQSFIITENYIHTDTYRYYMYIWGNLFN